MRRTLPQPDYKGVRSCAGLWQKLQRRWLVL